MPREHERNLRGQVLAVIAAVAVVASAGALGYRQAGTGGGGGGSSFSGTFDCYGTTGCSNLPTPSSCSSTISSGLQTALNNATGGEVICLNSGSYGDVTLTSKSYSSVVTVRPATNAAVTVGNLDLSSVSNLHFTGNGGGTATMSIGGSDPLDGSLTNFTVDYATYTDCTRIDVSNSMSNVLFDHDRFDSIGPCTFEGRIEIFGAATSIKLTVTNSHFAGQSGGNCTDGMQIDTDGGGGVKVGPGNEFTNITQGVCTNGAHADPVQINHGDGPITVTGNYFHDNGDGTGGLESFDHITTLTVTNNVFVCTCDYPFSVSGRGGLNWSVTHNTFAGGGALDFSTDNNGDSPTGNIGRDNAWIDGGGITGSGFTASYDLNCGCSGSNLVSGTAVLVSSPSSGYYHYQLDSTSPGYNAGSDGKSMGIGP